MKVVIDITQKLILEMQLQSEFTPINANLCRATLALWAALDASKGEEEGAERLWMRELGIPAAERSSDWI